MPSNIGWVEAEGTEGKAQEAGKPSVALKAARGDRVVVVAAKRKKKPWSKGRQGRGNGERNANGETTGGSA
jgi:hypothetical protein